MSENSNVFITRDEKYYGIYEMKKQISFYFIVFMI